MPPRETGKQRAKRIPPDYYKHPDRLSRWKWGLTLLALLLPLCWWASGLSWRVRGWPRMGVRARLVASHGPLARPHSTWDAQCEACHVPFKPIDGGSWAAGFLADGRIADKQCQGCHAGPPHHANERGAPSCAGCHRDHRGRDASLIEVDEAACTRCHADLASHAQPGARLGTNPRITRFDAGHHPEFSILGESVPDPGTVKFSHKVHMARGLNPEENGLPLKTLAELPEDMRSRYARPGQKSGDPVQLECGSCHRLDAGDFGLAPDSLNSLPSAVLPPRASGATMLPITYENQCRACHPLEVAATVGSKEVRLPVKHRLQPAELHQELENLVIGETLKQDPTSLNRLEPKRRIPGRPEQADERTRELVNAAVFTAERKLFGGEKNTCTECHHFREADGCLLSTPAPPESPDQPVLSFTHVTVAPAAIPQLWLRRATFEHTAHRTLTCRECHARAYADAPSASTTSRDVLLPGLATCLQCHAPPGGSLDQPQGGASTSCVECHRYHNGDAPLQGLGASARDATLERDIKAFLRGAANEGGRE
jgi:predicted CXXCH cytochrome family protein